MATKVKAKKEAQRTESDEESSNHDETIREAMRTAAEVIENVASFGAFMLSAVPPKVTDVEVVCCFADVRGFTDYCRLLQEKMQDRKIQNFLKTHSQIYLYAIIQWIKQSGSITDPQVLRVIKKHLAPTTYKNLGDGMMLVWEIPRDLEASEQSILVLNILHAIAQVEDYFYHCFRDLTISEVDAYSRAVENLDIGFGVAKGHVWRLDYGHTIDYAGSLINLASRLCDKARPKGRVVHLDVARATLENDTDGRVQTIGQMKGYGEVEAWISNV